MEQLLSEVFGKVFRAKCPHGCEHAGEGVLFKFSKGKSKDTVDVLEIGLDYHDNLLAVCTCKPGSSDNWVLLSVKNEFNPYTYAIHRIHQDRLSKYEIYISREGTADNYPLEEVDSRYEDIEYYVNRPSRKRSRHNSRQYSRDRSRSRSDNDDEDHDEDDQDEEDEVEDVPKNKKSTTKKDDGRTKSSRHQDDDIDEIDYLDNDEDDVAPKKSSRSSTSRSAATARNTTSRSRTTTAKPPTSRTSRTTTATTRAPRKTSATKATPRTNSRKTTK